MTRKLPAFLESVLLSLLCAWSGAGCLISAFSLRISGDFSTIPENIYIRKRHMHCHGAQVAAFCAKIIRIADFMSPVAAFCSFLVN